MSVVFNASNLHLGGNIDLTSTPQLLLTNSSTFDAASATATVTAQEVSGNGYARASLTVASNTLQPDGSYKLVYNIATFTASGGNIVFDRAVLYAQGIFVGWFQYGSTTIAAGTTFPFRSISISQTDSGTLVNGLDGINAQSLTTDAFTQPAVNSTVAIALTNSAPFPVGSYCYFTDGTNIGWYKVTAYGSPTAITIENLGLGNSAIPTTTMAAGGTIVPSGREGVGVPGLGLRFTYSATTTAPPSSGELRLNNVTIASVTSIFIHETDRNGVVISSVLATVGNGSIVMLADESNPDLYAYFAVTAQVDNGSYRTLSVTYNTGVSGTFSGNVSLMIGGAVSFSSGLTLPETSEPSTPSANNLTLFVDTVDGLLKQKTDAGAVSIVGGGGGGGGQYSYVGTVTAAGGESLLEFTGLTENHYSVFGLFQLSISQFIRVFANGDVNSGNYRRSQLYADGSTVVSTVSSAANIGYAYSSPAPFAAIDLKLGREPNGFFYAHCENTHIDSAFAIRGKDIISVYSASTISSLASVRFAPQTGTFRSGSFFHIYKLVTA